VPATQFSAAIDSGCVEPRPAGSARQLQMAWLPSLLVEIYVASFAGLLSTLLLAVVYLADRYEREPIELIQNFFLSGLFGQLVIILAITSVGGEVSWSGLWILLTLACSALYLPFQLHRQTEMDERFDGIVYSVAFVGGATCAIHLNNLPSVIAASPYRDALISGAVPDVRDLLILATSSGFAAELGQGFVLILAAVFVGAVLGTLQLRGWSPWQTAPVCVVVALAITGFDLLASGTWPVRGLLAVAGFAVALAVKRRSVFKDMPEPPERDVLVLGLRTVLMVFGAALLATVLLQAVVEQPEVTDVNVIGRYPAHDAPPTAGS